MKKQPPLSRHDLRQMDAESFGKLRRKDLLAVALRLLAYAIAAADRLGQTPENSSRPSSSMDPWHTGSCANAQKAEQPDVAVERAPEPAPEPVAPPATPASAEPATPESVAAGGVPPAKKKPGKQHKAKGFGRLQKLTVTDTEHHHAANCALCAVPLAPEGSKAYSGWTCVDLDKNVEGRIGVQMKVVHHLIYDTACACGHVTRATHHSAPDDPQWEKVGLGEWRLVGPMLAGVIVFLAKRARMSRSSIKEFFHELFDLELSRGVICETIREAGRAVAPLEEVMAAAVEDSDLVYADETTWEEWGVLLWMWVFVGHYTKLYCIGSRGMEILSNALTDKFKGKLMTDGYLAYRRHQNRLRCWAHLLRKLQGLADSADSVAAGAGRDMLDLFCVLMAGIYEARELPKQEKGALASKYAPQIAFLKSLCETYKASDNEKLGAVAREFLNDWDAILRQVSEPHLPLTNNEAERALRHWVIARLISHGTRSASGTRAFAMLASVIETCRMRGASAWRYIGECVDAARKGIALPPLPPIPVAAAAG